MATCLRITPQTMGTVDDVYDASIDFDEDETLFVSMKPVQTCEILVNQNYPAFVYDNEKTMQPTSTKRMIINIRILHYDKNTKTKLLTLFGYERAMKVYWKYKLSDSDYKKCVLDPNIEEIYYNGMQAAKIITNLKLYETW